MINVLGNIIDEREIKAVTAISEGVGQSTEASQNPIVKFFNIVLGDKMLIPIMENAQHNGDDVEKAYQMLFNMYFITE
jgi:hypothetical protein